MDRKKTLFDYASEVMAVYGFTIAIMNVFCLIFGESSREISSLFALGDSGIAINTLFEFLGLAVLLVCFRILFFTDFVLKRMSIVLRTVCLMLAIVGMIVVFVLLFGWFPVNRWQAWAMFLVCFGISFLLSLAITSLRERQENKRMEEALAKLKAGDE